VTLSGACLCGAVAVRAEGEPITVRACWCRDCQKITGGGATHNAFFRIEHVVLSGALRWYDSIADSGNPVARAFCATCGTSVGVQSHVRRHLMGIRVGMFDPRDGLAPRAIIWAASAPSWAHLDPGLPQSEGQPPPVA
jgi:hypothetical protein